VTASIGITRRDDQLSGTRVANASDGSLVVLDDERSGHVMGLGEVISLYVRVQE